MIIKRSIIVLLLLAVVSSLTGCRTLRAPSDFSDDWTPPKWVKAAKSKDKVWADIRAQEREVDVSKPLSVYELCEIALGNSPSTRQAWETARAAEAQKMQAQSAWYPKGTLATEIKREEIASSNDLNDNNFFQTSPSAAVSYLLFDFGGRMARVNGANQTLLAKDFLFNQSVQDLIRDVAKNYYELFSAKSSVIAAQADVDNAKTVFDAADQKFKAGVVSKLDVLQASSSYYSLLYSLEGAKGQVKTTQANLATVVGLPADTKYAIQEPSKELKAYLSKRNVSELIGKALYFRADVAAAKANVRAKEQAVWAANSDLWPSVNYQAGVTRDLYRQYNNEKHYADDYDYVPAGVTVTWDVFDGFNNLNKKRQAQAELRNEREKLRQTELAASADVWIKYYNYQTAIKKIKASTANLEASSSSYDLALEGYKAGLKSMLDLIQAQTDLSRARNEVIQAKKDMFTSLVELVHSIGAISAKDARKAAREMSK